jgi:hypothetical protein
MRVTVVYLYAFDIAHELDRTPIARLLGQPVEQFTVEPHQRIPRQLFFHRPLMARLPERRRAGPLGEVAVSATIKLLPVGAITIALRFSTEVAALNELVACHQRSFDQASLDDEARRMAEEVQREIAPALIRPVEALEHEEPYTVFCLEPAVADGAGARAWLEGNRRALAALLTQEVDPEALAMEEVEESTARALCYYRDDLVVADWDAALVIDRPVPTEVSLHLLELANLQLTELEAYDRILEGSIERAYRDLNRRRLGGRVVAELGEMRIDLSRLNDELSNITKFFGDWHLARVYTEISGRFHLADWQRSIDDKLKTLDGIYQVLSSQHNNRLMLALESIIVVLFVIDLVMIAIELARR